MWLEKSVMYPPLHSQIREVLASSEQEKVQFILEPLAFTSIAFWFKIHGSRFIQQLSYMTRTFAYYIDKEYKKIIKNIESSPPTPHDNHPTSSNVISVAVANNNHHPVSSTSAVPASTSHPHQSQPDIAGPTVEDGHHSKAGPHCPGSVSSPLVTTANMPPDDDMPRVHALGLAVMPCVPAVDLADVHGVPAQGLHEVIRAQPLPLSEVPTSGSTKSLMCPSVSTQTCTEQDCSNYSFPTQIFSLVKNQAGGGCARGVVGQPIHFNTRSEDPHNPISGAACDVSLDADYIVEHPTDPHCDSAGDTDHD